MKYGNIMKPSGGVDEVTAQQAVHEAYLSKHRGVTVTMRSEFAKESMRHLRAILKKRGIGRLFDYRLRRRRFNSGVATVITLTLSKVAVEKLSLQVAHH